MATTSLNASLLPGGISRELVTMEAAPEVAVRWFHAVDVSKSDSTPFKPLQAPTPPKLPSSWMPFSPRDSAAIEGVYQKLLTRRGSFSTPKQVHPDESPHIDSKVAVGEDKLFEVDIEAKVQYPVYWQGPSYEIRRGEWFSSLDGVKFVPVDENLNRQIEDGFKKFQPWKEVKEEKTPTSLSSTTSDTPTPAKATSAIPPEPPKWALFGPHLSEFVIYSSPSSAWLISNTLASRLSRFVTAGYSSGGTRLVRGWDEVLKLTAPKKPAATKEKEVEKKQSGVLGKDKEEQVKSATAELPPSVTPTGKVSNEDVKKMQEKTETEDYLVEPDEKDREIHHLVLAIHGIGQKLGERIESVNFVHDCNLMRRCFRDSSKQLFPPAPPPSDKSKPASSSTSSGKGQPRVPEDGGVQVLPVVWRQKILFGGRAKALREATKVAAAPMAEKQVALGGGTVIDSTSPMPKDHGLSFSSSRPRGESLGGVAVGAASSSGKEAEDEDDEEHTTTLEDITLDGVPSIRMLISDVVLDVLLYMTNRYRQEMIYHVSDELNRIYKLYKQRNPNFNGKVHIYGHSLGSLLAFDIVCNQPDGDEQEESIPPERSSPSSAGIDLGDLAYGSSTSQYQQSRIKHREKKRIAYSMVGGEVNYRKLDFAVDKLFAVGSPVGLFLLLKGDKLRAPNAEASTLDEDIEGDFGVSRPSVGSLYNLFHPHDPVAYRMEPLVSKVFAEEKPALIPYTKGGLKGSLIGIQDLGSDLVDRGRSFLGSIASFGSYAIGYGPKSTSSHSTPSALTQPASTSPPPQKDIELGDVTITSSTHPLPAVPLDASHSYSHSHSHSQSEDTTVASVRSPGGHARDASFGSSAGTGGGGEGSVKADTPMPDLEETQRLVGDLMRLNPRGRLDFSMQENLIESAYLSALSAHFGYWADTDIASFILTEMYGARSGKSRGGSDVGGQTLSSTSALNRESTSPMRGGK